METQPVSGLNLFFSIKLFARKIVLTQRCLHTTSLRSKSIRLNYLWEKIVPTQHCPDGDGSGDWRGAGELPLQQGEAFYFSFFFRVKFAGWSWRWSHWFQFFLEDKIFRWKWRRAQLSWQAWPVWSKMCPASRYVRWHVVTQSVKECKACHHGTQSVIRWQKMPQSVIQCHKYQQGIGWGLTKYHKVSPSVISAGSVRGAIWQLRGLPEHTEQQLQGRNHLEHGHHLH